MTGSDSSRPRPPVAPPKQASDLRRVASRDLLGEQGELVILHQGREYRLRITQNGKLILTA